MSQSFTVKAAPTAVSLTSAFNIYGIFANGKSVTNGGLDTSELRLFLQPARFFAVSGRHSVQPWSLLEPKDAVSNAKVTLPAGSYSTLYFLGTGVYGNQASQQFTVTYTDGSSYGGEAEPQRLGLRRNRIAARALHPQWLIECRPAAASRVQNWYLYEYSIALNSSKTVQSITLPSNRNVVVLAMTLAH